MLIFNTIIRPVTPLPDGIRDTFYTPSGFVNGSVKMIVNGQVYEPNDDRKGWSEVGVNGIQFINPPKTGDVIQSFYQDDDSGQGGDVVIGSPFDPNGVLP